MKTTRNIYNLLSLLKELNKIWLKLENYFYQYKIDKLLNKITISLKNII